MCTLLNVHAWYWEKKAWIAPAVLLEPVEDASRPTLWCVHQTRQLKMEKWMQEAMVSEEQSLRKCVGCEQMGNWICGISRKNLRKASLGNESSRLGVNKASCPAKSDMPSGWDLVACFALGFSRNGKWGSLFRLTPNSIWNSAHWSALSLCGFLSFAQFGLRLFKRCGVPSCLHTDSETLHCCQWLDMKGFCLYTSPSIELMCFLHFSRKGLSIILTFIKDSPESSSISILHIKTSIWLP